MKQTTDGSIAQLGEHLPYKQGVIGSSPIVSTKNGLVAQLVRALACHARGRGFEPHPGRHFLIKSASVAQLVEQGTENPRVVGSIPTGGTTFADLAHLVERRLAKAKVAGSSPVIRSNAKAPSRWLGAFALEKMLWVSSCLKVAATPQPCELARGEFGVRAHATLPLSLVPFV